MERSAQLVDFSAAYNPMDSAANAALARTRERVIVAWRKTDEGLAQAKKYTKAKSSGTSVLGEIMKAIS